MNQFLFIFVFHFNYKFTPKIKIIQKKIILNKDNKVIVRRINTQENRLITNTYRYQYTNKLSKILFAAITNQNQIER